MKFAIVESGGKQYRAVEGGTLEVDRLPLEIGNNMKLEQVLLLADGDQITVGTPVVKDTPIWVKVVEHFRGEKVTIFNYSPKKRIRVKTGHRQNYTRLLVEQIGGSELVKKAEPKAEPKAEKPAAPKAEKKPAAKAAAPKAEKKPAAKPAAAKATAGAKPKAAPKKTTAPKGKTTAKKSESK